MPGAKDIKGKMETEAGKEELTFLVDVAKSEVNTLLLRCLRMVIKDTVCPGINQTNRSPYGFWYPK